MKKLAFIAILGGLLLTSATATVLAAADADEARLKTISKNIDREALHQKENERAQALATEFSVSPDSVQKMRRQKQGWGEITVELAMAQRLAMTDPVSYPDTTLALAKVASLRSEKLGFGQIAHELGFKLGAVVSAAQRSQRSSAAHAEKKSRNDHATSTATSGKGKADHDGNSGKGGKGGSGGGGHN
ncbi:MAG: hypothetical protein HY308_08110 [Gammaproteobacteria bacterium]|nr:hypothetical protein [Gammaproteobacteria bacterium]